MSKVGVEGEEKESFTGTRGQTMSLLFYPSPLKHYSELLGAKLEHLTKGTNPSTFGN